MKFFCSHCGQKIAVETHCEGLRTTCPTCGHLIVVPGPAKPAETPKPSAGPAAAVPRGSRPWLTDVAIALGILLVLLLIFLLLLRPRQLGPYATVARDYVVGTNWARLVGGPTTNLDPVPVATPPPASGAVVTATTTVPPARRQAQVMDIADTLSAQALTTPPPAPAANREAVAQAIAERLDRAGAASGEVQISLYWNNVNDLDLHCYDPRGEEIYFQNKKSSRTSGELDVDRNASTSQLTSRPVENIRWLAGQAPAGAYRVCLTHYSGHGGADPTDFTIRTVVKGQTNYFSSRISYVSGVRRVPMCTFDFNPTTSDPSRICVFTSVNPKVTRSR